MAGASSSGPSGSPQEERTCTGQFSRRLRFLTLTCDRNCGNLTQVSRRVAAGTARVDPRKAAGRPPTTPPRTLPPASAPRLLLPPRSGFLVAHCPLGLALSRVLPSPRRGRPGPWRSAGNLGETGSSSGEWAHQALVCTLLGGRRLTECEEGSTFPRDSRGPVLWPGRRLGNSPVLTQACPGPLGLGGWEPGAPQLHRMLPQSPLPGLEGGP